MRLPTSFFRFFLLAVFWLLSLGELEAQPPAPLPLVSTPDSLAAYPQAAPVAPYKDTLFYVYKRLGAYTPAERAATISRKIKEIGKSLQFEPDSLYVLTGESMADIVYGETMLLTVTQDDADAVQMSMEDLASYYCNLLVHSIEQHRKSTSWWVLLKQLSLVLIIIALFYFLVKYIHRLFRSLQRTLLAKKGIWIKGLKIKSYHLMDENRAVRLVLAALKVFKYLVILLLVYLTLPLLFSVFPETRDVSTRLIGYFLTPLLVILKAVVNYIPNAITIVVIVVVFRYLIKGLRYFAQEVEQEKLTLTGFYPDWAIPTYNIVRTLLYAFMFVIIFPYLPGSDSKVFQGVSVFLGVVFSLGSTSLIGNLVSGMVLTYMRPFTVGDYIKIGEISGTVVEKTPFVIRILTSKKEEVTIPNSNIMSAHTTNFSTSGKKTGFIIHAEITVGYEIPWRQVHSLLLEAAKRTPGLLHDPEPFVLQTALDDFFARYEINAYTREDKKQSLLYSSLYSNMQDLFNEAGVELTSLHFMAHRDGNLINMPKEYIPKSYVESSFKVQAVPPKTQD